MDRYYYNNTRISLSQAEAVLYMERFRLNNGMGSLGGELILVVGINGGAFRFKSLPNV